MQIILHLVKLYANIFANGSKKLLAKTNRKGMVEEVNYLAFRGS